jgi:RNA polymerase sigma-70 factor, ECF subfamily
MAQTDDTKAFEAQLVALIPHLRAFGYSLAGNATQGEDLAQDALAKAWSARDSFEMGTNMKAWTFMILRNMFYSDKRRSWRSQPLDPETAERTLVATTGGTDRLELDEVRRALGMLPAAQREALILIGAAGLSYEEAAEVTQCAVGTVKSRVSRARDHLALLLAEGHLASDGAEPHAAMDMILAQVNSLRTAA